MFLLWLYLILTRWEKLQRNNIKDSICGAPGRSLLEYDLDIYLYCSAVNACLSGTKASSLFCNFRQSRPFKPWKAFKAWASTFLFPELTLYSAMREFLAACRVARDRQIPIAHAFVFCGGVRDIDDDRAAFTTCLPSYIKPMEAPTIFDEGFTKTFLSFFFHFCLRFSLRQFSPFTIFELAAFATFTMNMMAWVLLREKPVNPELLVSTVLIQQSPELYNDKVTVGLDDSNKKINVELSKKEKEAQDVAMSAIRHRSMNRSAAMGLIASSLITIACVSLGIYLRSSCIPQQVAVTASVLGAMLLFQLKDMFCFTNAALLYFFYVEMPELLVHTVPPLHSNSALL
ncbi:hypothetical protein C8J56DRAFT_1111413 [Mycena floridula]|nr:hypothetical protein C8J56DRAFT_1111413 [Mycena floridula]